MSHADHARRLASLAEAQRENASDLLRAVRDAHAAGMPWKAIGDALGVTHYQDIWRQERAGAPVVVARTTHDPGKVFAVRHADGAVTRHVPARHAPAFTDLGKALAMDMDLFCARCQGPHEDATGAESIA